MINEAVRILIPSSLGGDAAALNDFLHQNNYYQQLVYTALARGVITDRLILLGRQLTSLARVGCLARRPHEVEKIIQLMRALPLPRSVQAVADSYEGLRLANAGHIDCAQRIVYQAAED